MNKLVQILQYTFHGVVNKFYNPVKALENEQRKIEEKSCLAYNAYKKAEGEQEVQRGRLVDLQRNIEEKTKKMDKLCSTSADEDSDAVLNLASEIVLLQREESELHKIVSENDENLKIAVKALNGMKLNIQRNEARLVNLRLKQQMNKTAKNMLSLLEIDKNKSGEVSFESVDKQLTDEMRYLNGERKAIQILNNEEAENNSVEVEAKALLEERKQKLLLEMKK